MRGIRLDLAPQVSDMHVDNPGLDGVFVAPDGVEDLLPAQHLARVAGEEGQKVELRVGEVDLPAVAIDAALVDLGDHVAEDQLAALVLLLLDPALAQVGGDAGDQLARAEGLDDVVVGADLQPDDDVDLLGLGAEDEDRHPRAGPADVAADVEAADVGQHQVEEDDVRLERLDPGEGVSAAVRLLDQVPLLLAGEAHGLTDRRLVIDHQDLALSVHSYPNRLNRAGLYGTVRI